MIKMPNLVALTVTYPNKAPNTNANTNKIHFDDSLDSEVMIYSKKVNLIELEGENNGLPR